MAETAISGAEFTKMLQDIPARKVVVVLDCCHSGGIGELKGVAAPNVKAGFSEKYYDALQAGQGRVILASSSDNEESNIMPGDEHSLFTKHFIAGIEGGIASDDGMIRIFNLFEYVQPLVTSECRDQNPVFYSKIKDNFPIALYLGGKKGVIPKDAEGFRFDAYISYVNKEPDATWVRETLLPRLKEANLRIAISGRVGEPGVDRVVNIERGVSQAKRTILVLSKNYLAAHWATFESVLAQTMGIKAGTYPLLPVEIEPLDDGQLPMSLSMLTPLNLVDPDWAEEDFKRLIAALQGRLPRM
jgi:hypothetical protein